MNGTLSLSNLFSSTNARALAAPLFIVLILAMLVLPLPPFALDMLFTFNIALSIMVLLVGLSTKKALDFAAFPTVLLLSTLLRLSLNVASTRVVLLHGHTGPDAAGKVIEAFGHFLVGGNYAVGIIVFVILVVINFIVITKGAGRIAEVSARFTLDAMPGKQMAIDADLNAGLIDENEARRRRAEISQEADFYGSMDGASKFVRGDAIAGILILLINIVGGLVIGLMQHDLSLADAAQNYTLLAIGDGLVAQIPALVISIAAGIIVSRVSTEEDIAGQMLSNVFNKTQALYITAAILGMMGMIPGMPNLAFLLLAGGIVWLAWKRSHQKEETPPTVETVPTPAIESQEASWEDVAPIDTLGLEVGYRLIPLVDNAADGELVRRIKGIRKKFAREIGFLPPAVHIRDNLEINPNSYRITLKGVEIGSGEVRTGSFLAIDPGTVATALPGVATQDPAFGLPAVWIESDLREQAQAMGYTVVDPGTVVATHLNHLVTLHAAELLGRQEAQALLDHLGKSAPKLVEDLVPKMLPLSTVQKVLQNLLTEGVAIRDMRTIIDTLLEHAARVQDPHELTSLVRVALGRSIVQQIYGSSSELPVIALDQNLERLLLQTLQAGHDSAGMEPGLADTLLERTQASTQRQEALGHPAVLLTPAVLRPLLARFLRRTVPQLKVLSHAEVPEGKQIKVTSLVGGAA
ncbi:MULTISPECIES: flagellar biosynthesis protein FlhA [unclassified Thiobacillus]|uniref:flagellar biosynthesis protein FlhA n=1 Tax=unclassified Thiobacillus TaxID=2646513 RepID=UPI00086D4ADE|nr:MULTISPECIES: flagellar biosynthesis protein FlhA [unclassified Thiobacillus]MBN8780828.1 flagellar biosynthesis protein FlhA [Thiobacillus sp.]ODV02439.1 MAG: flagellar biosynthesis protein FlhA [Thiobacillus sp. SCN 63-57]OJY59203.1 MAG: flagellar biosynthesis protein FlhA [Thiobacillus sp. 0-1251]